MEDKKPQRKSEGTGRQTDGRKEDREEVWWETKEEWAQRVEKEKQKQGQWKDWSDECVNWTPKQSQPLSGSNGPTISGEWEKKDEMITETMSEMLKFIREERLNRSPGRDSEKDKDERKEETEGSETVKGDRALQKLEAPSQAKDPATRFTDWMVRVGLEIANLSSGAKGWWDEIVESAENTYRIYLSSDTLSRPAVEITSLEDRIRFQRLRAKVTSLLLEAVDENTSQDLISLETIDSPNTNYA